MYSHTTNRHRWGAAAVLAASLAWAVVAPAGENPAPAYQVSSIPAESVLIEPPKLPDLSPYTAEAASARIVRKPTGNVVLKRMIGPNQLVEFTGGDERLREWVKRREAARGLSVD